MSLKILCFDFFFVELGLPRTLVEAWSRNIECEMFSRIWLNPGKMVPGKNGPRKNGPREKWSPRKMVPGNNGPRKIGPRKNGPRKNGPPKIDPRETQKQKIVGWALSIVVCVCVWNVRMWSIYENPKLDNKSSWTPSTMFYSLVHI